MEGQKEHRQIRLSPYFRPAPEPRGFHARRLTRHHFLSNRWGLGQHRASGPPAFLPEMPQARSGLRPIFQRTQAAQTREIIQSTLDSSFGVLRDEIRTVDRSIQQLGKDISNQFAQGLERLLESRLGPACAERVGREENENRKNLQLEHQLEIDNLKREGELARQKLKEAEKDLEIANMQTQAAIGDLVRLQRIMDAQPNGAENDGKRKHAEKFIMTEFLRLRSSVRDLAESPLLQLGRLSDTTAAGGDSLLFSPQAWNRASTRQRRYRVMTAVFQLLFRRILRPGLRMFGVQVFLRSKEHQTISASEAHLRSLERELEANQVDDAELNTWVGTTIEATTPLRDIPYNVEGIVQEILEALSPVIRSAASHTRNKIRARISTICEEAVRLKLAIRQAPDNHKIEVPSRDAKKWGEPGCDEETRSLKTVNWLHVVDHETEPDVQQRREERQTRGDIVCIPFGALTKLDRGADGKKTKTILEKGWVVAKGDVVRRSKRKAPSPADEEYEDEEEEEEEEERPRKRAFRKR